MATLFCGLEVLDRLRRKRSSNFKTGVRAGLPVAGAVDSHTLPPKRKP